MIRVRRNFSLQLARALRPLAPICRPPSLSLLVPSEVRASSGVSPTRPPRSQVLQHRPKKVVEEQEADKAAGGLAQGGEEQPVRYGPLDVDLKPRDQLRPLLPTWNPPPTRPPRPDELEISMRLRFRREDRWWAATVREVKEDEVKVGYDGWPSSHDEWVPRSSDRMYLHESVHPEYEAPPLPQRYQRPAAVDAEGNPLPASPRPPRPRAYDPEKERLKRALRPPLPYNPEKERLKRLLRGQYAPPADEQEWTPRSQAASERTGAEAAHWRHDSGSSFDETHVEQSATQGLEAASAAVAVSDAGQVLGADAVSAAAASAAVPSHGSAATVAPATLPPASAQVSVEWIEVLGSPGSRAFRHATSGEICNGKPPSGWVEVSADGGARYYWNVDQNVTQWERPQ